MSASPFHWYIFQEVTLILVLEKFEKFWLTVERLFLIENFFLNFYILLSTRAALFSFICLNISSCHVEIHEKKMKLKRHCWLWEDFLCIVSILKATISTASKDLKDFFLESSSKQKVPFTVNFNHHYVQKNENPWSKKIGKSL